MCAPTAAVFAVAWVVFGYVDDSWRQLFPATFPTLVCTRLSLIGHNAGHKQINCWPTPPNNPTGRYWLTGSAARWA
jgi:fatty acid desaturase